MRIWRALSVLDCSKVKAVQRGRNEYHMARVHVWEAGHQSQVRVIEVRGRKVIGT